MPGHWSRALRIVECVSLDCGRSMQRDEPVYLIAGQPNQTVCTRCAAKRFQRTPPADLPHLGPVPELRLVRPDAPSARPQRLPLSDGYEKPGAFQQFNDAFFRGDTRKAIQRARAQQRSANAVDPKLKQIGGDE